MLRYGFQTARTRLPVVRPAGEPASETATAAIDGLSLLGLAAAFVFVVWKASK